MAASVALGGGGGRVCRHSHGGERRRCPGRGGVHRRRGRRGYPSRCPPRPAAEAAVPAAAASLLTAAGATRSVIAAVAAKGSAKDMWTAAGNPLRALAASGGAADATYTRVSGGPLETWLGNGGPASCGLPHLATPDVRRRVAGANVAVRRLLSGGPGLLFSFGEDAMNPVGGVVAVGWSPTLIVGLLVEYVST